MLRVDVRPHLAAEPIARLVLHDDDVPIPTTLRLDLAFDSDTARAFHDEDLDVDTDFCAMCGHDWCSVRISKEIVEFESGKAGGFERDRAMKSPALTPEQQEILRTRGHLSPEEIHRLASKTKSAVAGEDRAACHSGLVSDGTEALQVQGEKLLKLRRKGNEGAPLA